MLVSLIQAMSKKSTARPQIQWVGSNSFELEAGAALESIAPADAALMLSLWPELSAWERDVQAPMLARRPEDLVEWMTAGAAQWGVGEDARARRAKERDLSWVGFREHGQDTWKVDHSKTPTADLELLTDFNKTKVRLLAMLNTLNPLKFCVAKEKSSADFVPFLQHFFAPSLAVWPAMVATTLAGGEPQARLWAGVAGGLCGWLAWRAWMGWGSAKRRAAYLKYGALPWSARMVRAWRARKEAKSESSKLEAMFPQRDGLLIQQVAAHAQERDQEGRLAWLRERERQREAAFAEASDPQKAARVFEAWSLRGVCQRPAAAVGASAKRL